MANQIWLAEKNLVTYLRKITLHTEPILKWSLHLCDLFSFFPSCLFSDASSNVNVETFCGALCLVHCPLCSVRCALYSPGVSASCHCRYKTAD